MSDHSTNPEPSKLFGNVIYSYTREQAIEDGVLIDAGAMTKEAGFKWPVALTSAAWEDCVAWTEEDNQKQTHQDVTGRLWDVLCMASLAIKMSSGKRSQLMFELFRVPRNGRSTEADLAILKLIVGPGDSGEPVMTILLPNED